MSPGWLGFLCGIIVGASVGLLAAVFCFERRAIRPTLRGIHYRSTYR